MKKQFFFYSLILLLFSEYSVVSAQKLISFNPNEKLIYLSGNLKKLVAVTNRGYYLESGKKVIQTPFDKEAKCATLLGEKLFLGTEKGLLVFDLKTNKIVSIPELNAINQKIAALTVTPKNEVILATDDGKVFSYNTSGMRQIYSALYINCLNSTPDTSVWIGTNVGLYQVSPKMVNHFVEEGVANFEIPDNIIESLLYDNNRNLWVIMSNATSIMEFKATGEIVKEHEHIPSISFIGSQGNKLNSVLFLKKGGYLMATEQALYFLPTSGNLDAVIDNHENVDIIKPNRLLFDISNALPNNTIPLKMLELNKQQVIMADNTGVYKVNLERKFQEIFKEQASTLKGSREVVKR